MTEPVIVPADQAAARIVEHLLGSPATLGSGRMLCVDGRAGSGKTTLAGAVEAGLPHAVTHAVVRLDDIYPGWAGLDEGVRRVARDLVGPLADGRPGRYRRYDWHTGREAEWHEVGPVDLLVLEGVGAGALAYADRITTLVWCEASEDVRRSRALARDGDTFAPHWDAWASAEAALLARERTRDRADLVVAAARVTS